MKLEYIKNIASVKITDIEKCTGCGMCINVCPHEVFELKDSKSTVVKRDSCMECGACMKNCPEGIVSVNTGVGCAAAIINGLLNNTEASCDCSGSKSSGGCCG